MDGRFAYRPPRAAQRALLRPGGAPGLCVSELRDAGRAVISDYIFARDRLFARMTLDRHEIELYERAIEPAYLGRLREEYNRFFAEYDEAALLTVDTDAVDIFTDGDLRTIVGYAGEAGRA